MKLNQQLKRLGDYHITVSLVNPSPPPPPPPPLSVEALGDNGILVDAEADPGELLDETESTTEETR